jgi:hypothetical protein
LDRGGLGLVGQPVGWECRKRLRSVGNCLDVEQAKARIADDEFTRRRAEGRPEPYATTRSAGTAG